jgi:hypothetical protein
MSADAPPLERLSSGSTRTSLPALIFCLMLVGAGLVLAAIPLPLGVAWLSAGTGAATVLAGVGLTLHAALCRPESLRTETHSEITRPLPDRTE